MIYNVIMVKQTKYNNHSEEETKMGMITMANGKTRYVSEILEAKRELDTKIFLETCGYKLEKIMNKSESAEEKELIRIILKKEIKQESFKTSTLVPTVHVYGPLLNLKISRDTIKCFCRTIKRRLAKEV